MNPVQHSAAAGFIGKRMHGQGRTGSRLCLGHVGRRAGQAAGKFHKNENVQQQYKAYGHPKEPLRTVESGSSNFHKGQICFSAW